MCSNSHFELDVYGHHALATCTNQLSRQCTLTTDPRRVYLIACQYPNKKPPALVSLSTDRPADFLRLYELFTATS
jgi:hypothetical protein